MMRSSHAIIAGVGLVLLVASPATRAAGSVLIGPVVNPANGHAYYLLSQDSWTSSEAEAELLGGHLATINDEAEEQWVFLTFGNNRNLWIGFYNPSHDANGSHASNFVWASGEPVTYTNWAKNLSTGTSEPNNGFNGEEWYTEMWGNLDDIAADSPGRPIGTWNDIINDGVLPIFEINNRPFGVVETVPEPATFTLLGMVCTGIGVVGVCKLTRCRGRRSTFVRNHR